MGAQTAMRPASGQEGEHHANCPAGELDRREATQHSDPAQTL